MKTGQADCGSEHDGTIHHENRADTQNAARDASHTNTSLEPTKREALRTMTKTTSCFFVGTLVILTKMR